MKIPSIVSLRCFSASSTEDTPPQPFDELKFNDRQVARNADKLRRTGYFSVPVSPQTDRFLKTQSPACASAIAGGFALKFIDSEFEKNVTASASRIASALAGQPVPLRPLEFEVRWPAGTGASSWHQDRMQMLTCIKTMKGGGTEFVSPGTFAEKFRMHDGLPVVIEPIAGEASVKSAIRQMKKEKFYLFAAKLLEQENVPKLVHRAPEETGRTIFLARWREVRPDLKRADAGKAPGKPGASE